MSDAPAAREPVRSGRRGGGRDAWLARQGILAAPVPGSAPSGWRPRRGGTAAPDRAGGRRGPWRAPDARGPAGL